MMPIQQTGLPAVMEALASGGLPQGNLAQLPSPLPGSQGPAQPLPGSNPNVPLPNTGIVGPNINSGAQELTPDIIEMIVAGLLRQGMFNQGTTPQ